MVVLRLKFVRALDIKSATSRTTGGVCYATASSVYYVLEGYECLVSSVRFLHPG